MDTVTNKIRSNIMAKVQSKGNKSTELEFIRLLKKNHIKGWRRFLNIVGNPDFVFLDKKLAVFIDGCFWHGHNCRNLKPRQNRDYWNNKIDKNKIRDKKNNRILEKSGWKVIRIWECKLKNEKYVLNKLKMKTCKI